MCLFHPSLRKANNFMALVQVEVSLPFVRSPHSESSVAVKTSREQEIRCEPAPDKSSPSKCISKVRFFLPQPFTSFEVPETVTMMGRDVDLTPFLNAIQPISSRVSDGVGVGIDRAHSMVSTVQSMLPNGNGSNGIGRILPQRSSLDGLTRLLTEKWLSSTYLDESIQICRDDIGNVYVLQKSQPVPQK